MYQEFKGFGSKFRLQPMSSLDSGIKLRLCGFAGRATTLPRLPRYQVGFQKSKTIIVRVATITGHKTE